MHQSDPNLSLLETANSFIEQGKLGEAAIVLNQARAVNAKDPRVFMMAGLMAEKSGNLTGALQLMRTGVSLAPTWAPSLISLAQFQVRQGSFSEALLLAQAAVDNDRNNLDILRNAAGVAANAGGLEAQLRFAEEALALQPENTDWKVFYACSLRSLRRHDEALTIWNALLRDNPTSAELRMQRFYDLITMGNLEAARTDSQALLSAEPNNPIYIYYHARACGENPPQQPPELSRNIFDEYAATFNTQLILGLHYQLPKQVAESLRAYYPEGKFNLLDLGCGTGLLGQYLGKINGKLVGIDVSPKMLVQAEKLKMYTRLRVANLRDALQETRSASYDVITALDVCLYVGDLTNVIPAIYRTLADNGQLIFSCETAKEEGPSLVLDPITERYAHKRSNIQALLQSAGFTSVVMKDIELRHEKGHPVQGFVTTAFKPKAA